MTGTSWTIADYNAVPDPPATIPMAPMAIPATTIEKDGTEAIPTATIERNATEATIEKRGTEPV